MRTLLFAVLAVAAFASADFAQAQEKSQEKKLRIVIIDGQNNHNWRATTPVLVDALKATGRFDVDVSSNLSKGDKGPVHPFSTVPFPPDLSKYDILLSNYNGASWPKEFNDSLDETLKAGKIGLVIVHAANNAFGGWAEYNKMIGMGWRGKNGGDRLYLDEKGERVIVKNNEGDSSGHRDGGQWNVTIRNGEHPITKGMPKEWKHAGDELYDNMRGPIENVTILATAYSKGTKVHEPMIWTVDYYKGRVFHTPMGHDAGSMSCVGFQTTVARGSEWAATGRVTLPIPENFPTEGKTSTVPKK